MRRWGVVALAGGALFLLACTGGSKDAAREVAVAVERDGCTPTALEVRSGERVTFVVVNRSGSDREIEGIDGIRLEEVKLPKDSTRRIEWTAPANVGAQKMKCYAPGGPTTLIEVTVGPAGEKSYSTNKAPNATVDVRLDNFTVRPGATSAAAGPIKFAAHNDSKTDIHELAVLRIGADGSKENTGEIEDIDPGKSADIVLDLPSGKYQLACVIAKGEAKSTVDHYQSGMHVDFEVK